LRSTIEVLIHTPSLPTAAGKTQKRKDPECDTEDGTQPDQKKCSSCCHELPYAAFEKGRATCSSCLSKKRAKAAQNRNTVNTHAVLCEGIEALHAENQKLRTIAKQLTQQNAAYLARIADLEAALRRSQSLSGSSDPSNDNATSENTSEQEDDLLLDFCHELMIGNANYFETGPLGLGLDVSLQPTPPLESGFSTSLPGVGQGSSSGSAIMTDEEQGAAAEDETLLEDRTSAFMEHTSACGQWWKSLAQQYWAVLAVTIAFFVLRFLPGDRDSVLSVGPVTVCVVWLLAAVAMLYKCQIDLAVMPGGKMSNTQAVLDAGPQSVRRWAVIVCPCAILWRVQNEEYVGAIAFLAFAAILLLFKSSYKSTYWLSKIGLLLQIGGAIGVDMDPQQKDLGLLLQNLTRGALCLWLCGPTETIAETSALAVTGLWISHQIATRSLILVICSISICWKLIQWSSMMQMDT